MDSAVVLRRLGWPNCRHPEPSEKQFLVFIGRYLIKRMYPGFVVFSWFVSFFVGAAQICIVMCIRSLGTRINTFPIQWVIVVSVGKLYKIKYEFVAVPPSIVTGSGVRFVRQLLAMSQKMGCFQLVKESESQILVVDDDREIRSLLADYLEKNGLKTLVAADGASMWRALDTARVDLIVLDLMLPGEDGLTLCRTLRTRSNLPIIMLTARREPLDRILGLEMGADDYLPKPFEPRELLARIRSVLRRAQALPENLELPAAKRIVFAGWRLDLEARHLLSEQGIVVLLSGAEFRLLKVFLDHPHSVLNRDQLLDLTRGRTTEPFDRSVDLQVSRLRQKLADDAHSPHIIKTVRNEGYVLAVPVVPEH